MNRRFNYFGHNSQRCVWPLIPVNPYSQTQWWQHHAVGMFFCDAVTTPCAPAVAMCVLQATVGMTSVIDGLIIHTWGGVEDKKDQWTPVSLSLSPAGNQRRTYYP